MGWRVQGMSIRLLSAVVAIEAMGAATGAVAQPVTIDTVPSCLDNGVIRVCVDLARGGTITYLSTSLAVSGLGAVNVINSHDLGREVQQSYYSGPRNFGNPGGDWPNWPWNPEGAGDTYGNPAPILAHSNDGLTIYTKTAALQWALDNVPCECLIEQWITLDGNSVQVHNRLTNFRADHTEYAGSAELPAAYTNGTYWRLFTYNGGSPYTNAPLTQLPLAPPPGQYWWSFSATEHWAALVDDSGFGLGVFNAFATSFAGGFAGTPDVGGPSDGQTGYIAPSIGEILDWNIVYEYDYALVLGTLDEIRAYAVAHRPDDRPDYRFAHDRQHFATLANATDAGWPISGALHVNLDQNDPYIIGPEQWFQASEVPFLYITAAHHTSGTHAQVFWTVPGAGTAEERSVRFEAIPDGQYHTYAVHLAASPTYQGTITGIRFDPTDGNDPNGYVDIASITWKSPALVNYQGLWWAAPAGSESGWGLNLAHQSDIIFATWFTYDASGKAWWLSMTAPKTAASTYGGTLYTTSGPAFSAVPFDPTQVKPTSVGSATLTFSGVNNGSFEYTVNGISQTKAITREVFGLQPSCATTGGSLAAATNYQDLWWAAPPGSESGWGMNFSHQGDTIFATWFTYDLDGTPMWLVVTAPKTDPWTYAGTLYRTTGPAFNAVPFNPANVVATPVGNATFTFADGNSANFAYTVSGASQTKVITRQVFQNPGTVCK